MASLCGTVQVRKIWQSAYSLERPRQCIKANAMVDAIVSNEMDQVGQGWSLHN